MSVLFFLMAAHSIVSLVRSGVWLERESWRSTALAFALAMASALVVIFPAQVYHHDLQLTPYDEAVRLLLAIPIFLAFRAGNTPVTQVLGVSFPAGAILAMVVVAGTSTGPTGTRLGTYFLNPIQFGNLALMLGFLSLYSLRVESKRSPIPAILKLCGLFAGIYLSFRSGTRGGWLAIPVLLILWITLGVRLRVRTSLLVGYGLIAAVGVASFFMFDLIHQRAIEVQSDLATFAQGNEDTPVGLRLQILTVVAKIIQNNPLFGAGLQGYKATLADMARAGIITREAVNLGTAEVHNQLLSYAVKYGLPGLLSCLAIHAVPLVIFWRTLKTATGEARIAASMGLCLVTGFFIFGLTVEILNLKHTVTFYSLTLAVLLGAATRRHPGTPPLPAH
jgi:O-antigen ligase